MKKIILILNILFLSSCFSQINVVGQQKKKQKMSGAVTSSGVNNQQEEIDYFNAYLLPVSEKANLQTALNTYGSVRLEKGDYTGMDIVMTSNQKLYGHSGLSRVDNVTISAGSTNVVLENLFPLDKEIILQAGAPISNCKIKTVKWATIKATNAILTNNTFINHGGRIDIDCSASGYFRNNKIIRHQSGGLQTVLTMKGNSTTPSYGNVHLWSNFLTPNGNTTDINNLQSATFVGVDTEAWNFGGTGTLPMLYMQNMGDVKITDLGGGNSYSAVKSPILNIDANNLTMLNKYIQGYDANAVSTVAPKTNVLYYEGEHDNYVRGSGTVTGFDLKAHYQDYTNYNEVTLNGAVQSTTISNPTAITNAILGTQYTPWSRPNWETLPDPLGVNWKTERVGKPDSRAYIQNLIDTNNIADLPEGTFYISSTLFLPVDQAHGITGKGTGKTVICGLTDDFPLISLTGGQDDNFVLSNLTLQGGSVGVYSSQNYGTQHIAFLWIKYVVFRDQNIGFHLKNMIGFDNNFFDNISFVNCGTAFWQEPLIGGVNDNSSFVDKTTFYNGQFINCNTAISMLATRADNLNAWVNCKFDNNALDFALLGNNFPIAANCDFTNNRGEYNINGEISLYSCNFYNNNVSKGTFMSKFIMAEGCNFLDNKKMFYPDVHYYASYYLLNSTVTGDVTRNYGLTKSLFSNSTLLANPTLSKTLVKIKNNVPTVLIDATPNPYPQLLVTQ